MTPLVSVIMPVYNSGQYLQPAVESILRQTMPDLELIIVDDGSTDGSPALLAQIAAADSRVKVITQRNQGQGAARNKALEYAGGQYYYFMDSDDLLQEDCFQKCLAISRELSLDVLLFDSDVIYEEGASGNFKYDRSAILCQKEVLSGVQMLKKELDNYCFIVSPCMMFISADIIRNHFGGFPVGVIHEDNILALQCLMHSQRVSYVADKFFIRRVRGNSTMTTRFTTRNTHGYITVCAIVRQWQQSYPQMREILDDFISKTLNSVMWLGRNMTLKEKLTTFREMRANSLVHYVTARRWLRFWI